MGALVEAAAEEPLQSPWDGAKVVSTEVDYACPAPPSFATTVEIGSYYVDEHASVADPKKLAAFQKASAASTQLMRR